MREINVDEIRMAVAEMVIEANTRLPVDIKEALLLASENECLATARNILQITLDNAELAACEKMALCQDTGLVVVDIELGQEVHLLGGDLEEAINQGISEGYQQAYLRKSMVRDPFDRVNTGDNTPAVIHLHLSSGRRTLK